MTCVICKSGEPAPGATTVTVTKDGTTVVISGVLLAMAKEAVRPGIKLELREYIAA